ncbi:glycosyltransferase [Eleftheria terrae]|uniref:glycosyltransferase n=1 Tax=Eleftheria terrae TaxID=1597781 RepID=UPI00263AE03C|nr:glycosyltransferase [Eleftheria terrae]WKB53898.1 glycosyltransferase [Eleftheria terrae]
MAVLGISLEPPFDPRSWSGSSKFFFDALRQRGVLQDALQVQLSRPHERLLQLAALSWPRERWRSRYNSSPARFTALSARAQAEIRRRPQTRAVLQIGARLRCAGPARGLPPVFGYHDGNAALRYRYYDQGLLSDRSRQDHLRWEGEVYGQMRGIFVMSAWLADSFMKDFNVPADKLHVVGAGINFPTLPVVPQQDFAEPHFLFVGREFKRKGGEHLLAAFAEVRRALPRARLSIVGPDAPGTPAPDGVQFAGFLSKSDPAQAQQLQQLFAQATAQVLPSVYEPFGISLLEGMAWGLPCIASDRCAMPEIVEHGHTGLIAAAEHPPSLAAAMIELGRQPDLARRMGQAGRQRVERQFTWDAVAGRIQGVLRDQYRVCP